MGISGLLNTDWEKGGGGEGSLVGGQGEGRHVSPAHYVCVSVFVYIYSCVCVCVGGVFHNQHVRQKLEF